MKKEVTLSIFSNAGVEEALTTDVANIAEKYGVTFFKNVVTTYSFSELSEDAQETVLERERENGPYHDWYEYQLEQWKENLEKIGFDDADIRFSGFWSQGDGASFTARCDAQKIVNTLLVCEGKMSEDMIKNFRLWFELAECGILSFDIVRQNHYYAHENTVSGTVNFDLTGLNDRMWYAPDPKKPYNLDSVFETRCHQDILEPMFEEFVRDLCKKIYSDLEDEYNYLISDDYLREYLLNTDNVYDEFGNLA